jgi:hypothetical protein
MNERIRELAKDCDLDWHRHWNDDNSNRLEKFAELIVQECVSTLTEMHMWQSVNNQNYTASWHDAVDNGIETIKEHFGVKQ